MKTFLLLVSILVVSFSAFGQGRVSFRNTASTSYYLYTNNALMTSSGWISGANAYRIGLYASTSVGASESSLTLIGLATNSAALPGRFLGPNPYALPAQFVAGSPITFQLRAWSFAGGLTYEEALVAAAADPLNVATGTSPLGTVTPTAVPSPAAELFGTNPGQLSSGFCIGCIPEPSTHTLASLGAVALLLFSRHARRLKPQR